MPSTILSDNGASSGTAGIKTTGSNDGALQLQTTTAGGTATAALTIDTSQRVGIGTASPSYKLDINEASTYSTIGLRQGGTLYGFIEAGSSQVKLGANAAIPLLFEVNGSERARISSAGGFSVGTTADPGAGAIYATGNITAYYSSDRKFKENIKPIEGALDKVVAIGGKTFDWTDEYIASKGGEDGYFVQKSDFGVVAQDVQAVFPQAVRTREDGSLAVDYEKLSALAFAAIVELKAEVEALKKG